MTLTLADVAEMRRRLRKAYLPARLAALRARLKDWREEDHPRADDGKFGQGSGGAATDAEPAPKAEKPKKAPPKLPDALAHFRNRAVRNRVKHGLRNEKELSDHAGAYNLPDSEPADVVLLIGPGGEQIVDPQLIKAHLNVREDAVKRLALRSTSESTKAELRQFLADNEMHLFEVKTLITQKGEGKITMAAKARRRKERWEKKYAAPFHSVGFDDRKGKKFSGNRLYYRRGVGTTKLSSMTPCKSFDDLLDRAARSAEAAEHKSLRGRLDGLLRQLRG